MRQLPRVAVVLLRPVRSDSGHDVCGDFRFAVEQSGEPVLSEVEKLLSRYRAWLCSERGLATVTARNYADMVRSFLSAMGLTGAPLSAHVTRWERALPHYEPGHLDRVARIERHLEHLPGVALAGAAYRGMGVPQCIVQGQAAAERVLSATARSEGVVARMR
jgi:hypothetical protein